MSQIEEPFASLLDNLASPDVPLKAALIYRLSDPIEEEMAGLVQRWPDVPVERKRALMARIAETSETNFELDFTTVSRFALHDSDPEVRTNAISALWTSEEPEVMYELIEQLKNAPDETVRAAAAENLGQFVLLGELGHLPSSVSGDAERILLDTLQQEPMSSDVYRRSLESLGYSSHHDVLELIDKVARENDVNLRASSILAMGRNAHERWHPNVVTALSDPEEPVRFEAVRAAGELGLVDAVPALIDLANAQQDREMQEMAIWSLGEIGGQEAQDALFALAEKTDDDDLLEAIEDASNMAALSLGDFGMYMMAPDDDDDLMLEDLEGLDADDGDPSDES